MNLKSVRVKVMILFVLGCISNKLFAQVEFQETSLRSAQSKIATTNTPYLIYFSGVWCPSCQLMEETTFSDQKLGDQIQKNYLAYKVDVDSEDGKKWMEEYAVSCLPTTIFYSAESQLLERLEKPITSTELLAMTTDNGFRNSSLLANNSSTNPDINTSASNININPQSTGMSDLEENSNGEMSGSLSIQSDGNITPNSSEINSKVKGTAPNNPSYQDGANQGKFAGKEGSNSNNQSSPTLASQNNSNASSNSTQISNNLEGQKAAYGNGKVSNPNAYSENQKPHTSSSQNGINNGLTNTGSNALSTINSTHNSNGKNQSTQSKNGFSSNVDNSEGSNTQAIANFNALIEELAVEINELKALSQANKNEGNKHHLISEKNSFSGSNSNGSTTLNNNTSETFLSPSTDNLMAQIAACKNLLTDAKSLDKLIGILENYQHLLIEMKATQIELAQQATPSEYANSSPTKKAVSVNIPSNKKTDLLTRNQQIISYLKLNSPVKNGNQYIVQIGKYSNVRNAERLVQIIQNKFDYPIKVLIENKNNLPIQTVYLGEFKTQKEAIAANNNLKWIKRKGIVKRF